MVKSVADTTISGVQVILIWQMWILKYLDKMSKIKVLLVGILDIWLKRCYYDAIYSALYSLCTQNS